MCFAKEHPDRGRDYQNMCSLARSFFREHPLLTGIDLAAPEPSVDEI
jgi:hypothetical protein